MVVRIPHGPARGVLLGLLVRWSVDVPNVSIGPLTKVVVLAELWYDTVVDVPVTHLFVQGSRSASDRRKVLREGRVELSHINCRRSFPRIPVGWEGL